MNHKILVNKKIYVIHGSSKQITPTKIFMASRHTKIKSALFPFLYYAVLMNLDLYTMQ